MKSENAKQYVTPKGAIRDFLRAVDRGDFGEALMVGPEGDRCESSYLQGLREAVALEGLVLQGKAGDPIWIMEDGEDPHVLGVRMDSGDSGAVYLTRDQAADLGRQLLDFATPAERHTHVAHYDESNKLTDKCGKCGRDLRDDIHIRMNEG